MSTTVTTPKKSTSGLRVPPQNIESEQALIGSILLRPEAMYEVTDMVTANSFYADKHRLIYEAMIELFQKHEPIDMLSLSNRLKEKGILDQIGGNEYLTDLTNAVPSSANLKYYAKLIQKKFMMRGLIDASEFIGALGYDDNSELEEILDKAEKRIYELSNASATHKFVEMKDELTEAWERLDKLHNSKEDIRGVPTGFPAIDNTIAGLQPSDLIILAARPSMGKTALALDIARQAAVNHNVSVGIFSLEMSSQQLVDRMLAAQALVDAWKLRTGKLTSDEDFKSIQESLDKLSRAPIYIDDEATNNILKMRSVARRLKSEKGLDLIIVDYLQLMQPIESRGSDSTVQQITEISRSLKQLARELDVPVLALSQLSRAVEQRGGRPKLSDLRDSGAIEQDADVVMFIHREKGHEADEDNDNIAEILIEKHRNGPTGIAQLHFNDKKSTFQSIEKGQYAGVEDEFASF
ncbi:MAG: replicative DNA helicase [Candidatus Paceibacterota bacterium]